MAKENALREQDTTRAGELKSEYKSKGWEDVHKNISDFIYTQGGRFDADEDNPNDGERRDSEIIDSTATQALRTLQAGLFSGAISPVTKWFLLTIDDPNLKDVNAVKLYFDQVTEILLSDFSKSNFYTASESLFGELGAFGTSAVQIEEDANDIFRFTPFTIGEYFIDTDFKGRPNAIYRYFKVRARNVISEFGIDNVSANLKIKTERADYNGSEWIELLHVQMPNFERDTFRIDAKNKPWRSTYHEVTAPDDQKPLRESGYDEQPFAAPRWSVTGSAVYGVGPGTLSLGDVKELQTLSRDLMVGIAKQVEPPLLGDANKDDMTVNTGPSQITWIDGLSDGNQPALQTAYNVDININDLAAHIITVQNRIKASFFSDLFFLLDRSDNRQKTATEIIAVQRRNLQLMGPIIERLNPEYLRIVIARCFDIEKRLGRLPEPPKDIQGSDIKVELISLIAQAQKLADVTPIQQFTAEIQAMAQTFPEVLDIFNVDAAVRELANSYGIDPKLINSKEVVENLRQIEAQRLQEQEDTLKAQAAISGAKELSETDVSGDNALTALAGGGAR